MLRILATIFAGLFGLAFGSFLNVCLSRWPKGESIVLPRSHCCHCGRTLAWWENLPLASWLALRGRCRTCRAWIGFRYPLVEFAVGALWAFSVWQLLDPSLYLDLGSLPLFYCDALAHAVGNFILYWLLIALAVLDAENLWLPNRLTFPGIVLGFSFVVLRAALSAAVPSMYQSAPMEFAAAYAALCSILGILAAAGLILLIRWLYWLVRRREGIGLGDARLMALLAAWLGLPGALLAFVLGVVLGALAAVLLLAIPSARNKSESWGLSKLPLGTFLCIGGIVSSLWGQPMISAYLRWAGFY
jgi:leader peptidase (prepilin peptidase)/N-methyltransferase